MVETIGNPLSWGAKAVGATGHYIADAADHVRSPRIDAPPKVRSIDMSDLRESLRLGFDDFAACRTDVMFLCVMYPLIGIAMAVFAFQANLVPYLFPMASGFALLGPIAGVALYELSRRREHGQSARWTDTFSLLSTSVVGPIVALGAYLVAIFLTWMVVAHLIFVSTMGGIAPTSTVGFISDVFSTSGGIAMIAIGIPVGAVFAVMVLMISVVSFPLLLDRDVGLPVAVITSIRVARKNPVTIGIWGLIIATALLLGSIPFFLGLIIVMPVLGHASWHLYRRAVG